jgi:hypothetical protein
MALAAAVGANDLRLDLSVRSEGRATAYGAGGAPTSSSAEVWPEGTLTLEDDTLRATAHYGISIRDPDLNAPLSPLLRQQAEVGLSARVDPTVRIVGAVAGERGWTDPLRDLWTPGVNAAAQPITSIPFETLRGHADGTFTLDRQSELAFVAFAAQVCGVGAAATAQLPCQRSEALEGSLATHGSTRDLTRIALGVSASQTEGGLDTRWASARLERREDLTRHAVGRAAIGATVSSEGVPGGPVRWGTGPLAELGLAATPAREVTVDLSARTGASVYRANGEIQQTASALASIRWSLTPTFDLLGSALGSYAWQGPQLQQTAVDARMAWRMDPRVRLELGVLGRRQYEPLVGPLVYREAAVFFALVAEAPSIR